MDDILINGFNIAKERTSNFKNENELEATARKIANLIQAEAEFPSASTLELCTQFLKDVESWKMMGINCRLGNAALNDSRDVYSAFRGMLNKNDDKEKLLSIMNLNGFGSSTDKDGNRRAKAASAVMRFFYPDTWGVVDWRLMAILTECEKHSWNWTLIVNSEKPTAKELRTECNIITEDICVWLMGKYRKIVEQSSIFSRVADVDIALFATSWLIWKR